MLTGRLPARAGLPYVLFPAEHHGLPNDEITLAELLKPRGYATACIGKWHLGWDKPFRPQQQGFDVFFGTPYSNDSNEWPVGVPFMQVMGLQPFPLIDGEKVIEAPVDQATLTKRYTERAVAFIRQNRERPFLLYLPHTMPHIPQYASPAFAGKSKAGLYGDTVEELDASVGVILDTLQELGLDERTLVVFTSDNGATSRGNAAAPGKNPKKTGPAATARFPNRSFGGSNGPLRGGKGTTFEGGIRVPFIARWKGTIPAGAESDAPISLMDLFPTCGKFSGADLPTDRIYDGRNIGDQLKRTAEAGPRALYHFFGYQPQAVREGKWKLFIAVDQRPAPRPASLWYDHAPNVFETQHRLLPEPQLYDLTSDPGESRNIAQQHPDIVARLTKQMADFAGSLQRDQRPMQFVPGPAPPAPQTIRTEASDLSVYRTP